MKRKRVIRAKKPKKPVRSFTDDDCIIETMNPEFDRLEAELEEFEQFINNDQEIKETFDRLDKELNRMELKI